MSFRIRVTQTDIDSIATKLDAFADVLSDREHALVVSIFAYARRAIEAEGGGGGGASRPPLSRGFRHAVGAGVGGVFEMDEDAESDEEFIKFKRKDSPREVHKEIHRQGPGGREVHKETHKTSEGGGETDVEVDSPITVGSGGG